MSDTLILCYHALSHNWHADLSVTPAAFAEQLHRLAKAGYKGVTFSEAVRRQARGKEVAVTFDDGFASVVTHAKPVLDELGWSATMYAVTSFAAGGRPLHWDGIDQWTGSFDAELASLDWDALRALRDDGWEIGSHTATHPWLTRTDDETLERELTESRDAIEAEIGECESIAYPYGDVDVRVIETASRAGYAYGAALPARWGEIGALEWPRVGIYRPDDLRRFNLKTSRLVRRARSLLGR